LHGVFGERIRHRSYFLSHITRPCYKAGTIDLVPSNFSEMRDLPPASTKDPLVVAAASPLDRHGYFSLGVSADYVASFVGRARFFLEANAQMPRTFGRNQLHVSQVAGWCEVDRPLVEVEPAASDDLDARIAAHVAERIPDGATIQVGIGATPNAIVAALSGHRDLGVHTELISDGIVDLVEAGVIIAVEAPQPDQGRRHLRTRHRTPAPIHRRQPGSRAVAGQLRQRPARDRHGTGFRVDQLDAHR
jgi:acyl-CoA hydrolase